MCSLCCMLCFFFFFQAEDGIRDADVTGVQTCALPISTSPSTADSRTLMSQRSSTIDQNAGRICGQYPYWMIEAVLRSEERRVGKSVDLGGRRISKKKKKKKRR